MGRAQPLLSNAHRWEERGGDMHVLYIGRREAAKLHRYGYGKGTGYAITTLIGQRPTLEVMDPCTLEEAKQFIEATLRLQGVIE